MSIETIGVRLWKAASPQCVGTSVRLSLISAAKRTPESTHRYHSFTSQRNAPSNSNKASPCLFNVKPFHSSQGRPSSHIRNVQALLLQQQRRPIWTKSKTTEAAEVTEKDESVDLISPSSVSPRFRFYTSAEGAKCVDSLTDLPDKENIWKMMSTKMTKAEEESSSGLSEGSSSWLDVTSPSKAEIEELSRNLGLHRLTTEDILAKETQEKLEVHPNYTFISYCAFDADPQSTDYLKPVNIYIISFPHGTLSLRSEVLTLTDRMEKRLDRLKTSITISPDWIAYALIDEITDMFVPALKPVKEKIEGLSESLMEGKDPSSMLRSVAGARKKVMTIRRLLGSKVEVVKALIKRHNRSPTLPHTEMSLNLSDVEDHLVAVSQDLNHWEEIISHSENNCLMQLNLRMTQANNDASEAITKLTVLSTVILPLNVITGLWGMNVMVPGQGVDSLHWFGGLASLMVVVAFSGYLWATRILPRKKR